MSTCTTRSGPPNTQTLDLVLKLGVRFQAQPEKLHRPQSTEVAVGGGGDLPVELRDLREQEGGW